MCWHVVYIDAGHPVMQLSQCSQLLQVVQQINKRAGTDFVSESVERVNVIPIENDGGVGKAACKEAVEFKEASESSKINLYNIASQYAMDVIRFGYL